MSRDHRGDVNRGFESQYNITACCAKLKVKHFQPLVLNDSDIKRFKKLLSFEHGGIKNIWMKFCSDNFNNTLQRTFEIVERRPHDVTRDNFHQYHAKGMSAQLT